MLEFSSIENKLSTTSIDFKSYQPRVIFLEKTISNIAEPIIKLLQESKIDELIFYGEFAKEVYFGLQDQNSPYSFSFNSQNSRIPTYINQNLTENEIYDIKSHPENQTKKFYSFRCNLEDLRFYGPKIIKCRKCESVRLEEISRREVICQNCSTKQKK